LSFRDPHGAFCEAGGNCLRGEVGPAITFLGFELGEARDLLAGLAAAMFRRDLDLTDSAAARPSLFIDELLKL
jgi:hypothetical protein